MKILLRLFLSFMGVAEKAPFLYSKRGFFNHYAPRENDGIKALFRRTARGWFRRERNMFRLYAPAWGKCRFSLISKIITELLRSRCRLKTGFSSV